MNISQRICVALIHGYQRYISSRTPPSCRFQPTCSHYAIEAIKRFGAGRGILLSLWRLCRCQPFCRGGYDPVPPIFTFRRIHNHIHQRDNLASDKSTFSPRD